MARITQGEFLSSSYPEGHELNDNLINFVYGLRSLGFDIVVTSTFRNWGAPNSAHKTGNAIDTRFNQQLTDSIINKDSNVWKLIQVFGIDEVELMSNHQHFAITGTKKIEVFGDYGKFVVEKVKQGLPFIGMALAVIFLLILNNKK